METAKDKAKSLVEKYRQQLPSEHLHYDQIERLAVECAKIAVDEILFTLSNIESTEDGVKAYSFYEEVKNELNKM